MKRLLLLILIYIPCTIIMAQDQRTLSTRVADLLLKLPAEDADQLKIYMQEIGEMGENGLVAMVEMLSAPGEGDNSQLEYAIGGFTFYASQPGMENWRQMAEAAYCRTLPNLKDKNNQAFVISQLEKIGGAGAVDCMQGFLKEEGLCDPAARALAQINSPNAHEALLKALGTAQGSCRIPLINALGYSRHAGAVSAITPLIGDGDPAVQKSALLALSQIADPSSESVLKDAAESAGYTYEATDATAAYLAYAENLLLKGERKQAEKIAKNLIKKAKGPDQVQYRSMALGLWAAIHGTESSKELIKALRSDHQAYRGTALQLAADNFHTTLIPQWLRTLKRSKPEVQAEIIYMLAEIGVDDALPEILNLLHSGGKEVRMAAIPAVSKLGDEQQFEDLLSLLKKGDDEEITAVKEALFTLRGDQLMDRVAAAVPGTAGGAQAALIEVLAHRKADSHWGTVSPYLEATDPKVRLAAYEAIQDMAGESDLPHLFTLLKNTVQEEETRLVQTGIISVLSGVRQKSGAASMVLGQMSNLPNEKKIRFYKILASVGGDRALETLSAAFWEGNQTMKKAALDALSVFNGDGAGEVLFRISTDAGSKPYFDQAFSGYVRATGDGNYPDAQKLLLLRQAMGLANTAAQKRQVLAQVGGINSFSALVYAGQFLKDPEIRAAAASNINRIATGNPEIYGATVRELLREVQSIPDALAGYQRDFLQQHLDDMPSGEGFVSLFNGKDLTGWKGLVGNPIERAKMDPDTLKARQEVADEEMRKGWIVENEELLFTGKGNNLATEKKYGDFELLVDWKIYDDGHKEGDGGIYLRGTPQVQIWDTSRVEVGAQVGSGGLYNNQVHPSDPLKVADNPLDEWNNFHIIMRGDTVTVFLNGELVTDQVVLENFWDRSAPLFPYEQIELQAHGSRVAYRDIYIKEIGTPPFELSDAEREAGFKVLFDGSHLDHWIEDTGDYFIENGNLVLRPKEGSGGNFFTKEEYSDFEFRFEFLLTPAANNGLGIRAPLGAGASYQGMELQILDNTASIYQNLEPYQYHGSVYGILPAERGALKPVGEWNYQEVVVKGPKIKITLNGKVILDGDLTDARENGAMDGLEHPGMFRETGHVGFLGHDSEVWFRNVRVRDLSKEK